MDSEDSTRTEKRRLIVESRIERERKADQLTKAVLAEEDARRATDAKKTARLKGLREAKEAAESEALAGSTRRTTGKNRRPDLQDEFKGAGIRKANR
jgi:hypothetical protein